MSPFFPRGTTTQARPPAHRYTGAYLDPTGPYETGHRYYDPRLGRFSQPDPSGQEINPCLYAAGDPIDNIDPSGLFWDDIAGVFTSGAKPEGRWVKRCRQSLTRDIGHPGGPRPRRPKGDGEPIETSRSGAHRAGSGCRGGTEGHHRVRGAGRLGRSGQDGKREGRAYPPAPRVIRWVIRG
ncbi:RHS repeat-associated core domain-containing protein [Streptomyces sp. NPDC003635]